MLTLTTPSYNTLPYLHTFLPQELCLHDNHLTRFRLASSLPQLVKLLLSFNDLTSVEDIQHLVGVVTRSCISESLTHCMIDWWS